MEKITKSSDSILIDPNEPLILPDGTALVGRVEWFLYALCCLDYQNLPTPMSRIEEFANALITGEIPNIEPQSRAEKFFLAILDGNVSDLPRPQSRSEVLLDKLARGEFDLSDVEPIQSRYELLLAYLIKNGGIGNIDYVLYEFSEEMKTMYNTVEKPFKSLELSGNTKVNVLQESVEDDVIVPYQVDECQGTTLTGTKETGSLDNLMINGRTLVNSVLEDTSNSDYVSFDQDYKGQSFTINGTNEGAIKSAILSGNTLVNLFDTNLVTFNNNQTVVENGIITIPFRNHLYNSFTIPKAKCTMFKPSTTYTLIVDMIENNGQPQEGETEQANSFYIESYDYSNSIVKSGSDGVYTCKIPHRTTGRFIGTFVTHDKDTYDEKTTGIMFTLGTYYSATQGQQKLSIVILEGDYTNIDIPYFEGMQSVKLPVLTTVGKNLLDRQTLKQGYIDESGEFKPNSTDLVTDYIKILPNTKYTYKVFTNIDYKMRFSFFNENKSMISRTNAINVTNGGYATCESPSNACYVRVHSNNFNVIGFDADISLVMSDTPLTLYEPYKSNILTANEPVELRGIGDIRDELDCLNGQLTQRIGEINTSSLNESHFFGYVLEPSGLYRMVINVENLNINGLIKCNKLPVVPFMNSWNLPYECITIYDRGILLYLKDTPTVESFVNKAIGLDLIIQYVKVQNSVKTVDLNVVDQNNTKIDKIHVFNETTHVNASSDELTPTVNIGKSVSYPTTIKPNTKYTVDLKRNDKPLTVNLGGTEVTFTSGETRKIITTPSTLTNDKLSYYGIGQKCSDIMVLEGEVEGNVDYFTGMQSVVNPILYTSTKNILDEHIELGRWSVTVGEVFTETTHSQGGFRSKNPTRVKPNTDYVITGDFKGSGYLVFGDDNKIVTKYIGGLKASNTEIRFRTSGNEHYIHWYTVDVGETDEYKPSNIQLEIGMTPTSYVPHKSTILSCDEDVELYSSPNGVYKDYINIPTHKLFKTNNVVTVNGSENWTMYSLNDEYPNTVGFYYTHNNSLDSVGGELQLLVDGGILKWFENERFPGNINTSEEGIGLIDNKYIKVSVLKSRLETVDVNGFKKWLTNNPITVQYVTNPTVKTINISIIDQDNVVQSKLHTFNDTTHIMTSSDELTPIIKCDGKLEYPVVIKPSTQYTILANTSANGHALNNIAFDLGGAKVTNTFGTRKITITTPSTLTDNSLTITGEGAKVSELMVLEGNESDTLPYFEGMSSCKMPILSTVGKNLFNPLDLIISESQRVTCVAEPNRLSFRYKTGSHFNSSSYIQLEPNTKYWITITTKSYNKSEDEYVKLHLGKRPHHDSTEYGGFFIKASTDGTQYRSFTTDSDAKLYINGYAGSVGYDIWDIMLEKVEDSNASATPYEPYKTSILSCNEDVTLCGIGEVKDELDLLTGELTQRVGEIVIDGSDDENWRTGNPTDDTFISFLLDLDGKQNSHNFTNNKLANKKVWNERIEGIWADISVVLTFKRTSLPTQDLIGARQWLSQNPITVQYELATESVKTVDLNAVDQDGNTIPKIKSYNGVTHLEVTVPKQSLLPNVSAEVATDNSKDMSSLTIKHQEINEAQSAIEDNIQSQSDEIDTALMATTEIFESILE